MGNWCDKAPRGEPFLFAWPSGGQPGQQVSVLECLKGLMCVPKDKRVPSSTQLGPLSRGAPGQSFLIGAFDRVPRMAPSRFLGPTLGTRGACTRP